LQVFFAGLRILARIEVRNGYALVAPRPPYLFLGGEPVLDRELVEDVGVSVEGQLRGVAGLAGDLDDAAAFVDQERHERVAKVVGAGVADVASLDRGCEGSAAPVLVGGEGPRRAVVAGEDESVGVGPAYNTRGPAGDGEASDPSDMPS
jgi:hypothetical protein